MISFTSIIIFLGCTCAWVGALGQLMAHRQGRSNIINFFLLFCIGSMQLQSGLYFSGLIYKFQHICIINIPILYCIGPLLYFSFKHNIISKVRFSLRLIFHFLPSLISTIILIPFYFKDSLLKINFLQELNEKPIIKTNLLVNFSPTTTYNQIIIILIIGSMISLILYLFPLLRKTLYILNQKSLSQNYNIIKKKLFIIPLIIDSIRALIISIIKYSFLTIKKILYILNQKNIRQKSINIITYLLIVLLILNSITGLIGLLFSDTILKSSAIILTILLLGTYLSGLLYPEIFRIKKQNKKPKNKHSYINNLNVPEIINKLNKIMEDEKAFADEDITIESIAKELTITLHQLSQILNEKLNKNFKTFLREYRIKEACTLLLNDSNRSILSIAYAVGFRSKSAFNTSFLSITNLTPSKYRQKYLKANNTDKKSFNL